MTMVRTGIDLSNNAVCYKMAGYFYKKIAAIICKVNI